MSNELTPEQLKELQELADGILDEAKKVKEDYKENPSDVSGSIHPTKGEVKGVGVMVGLDSQYLDYFDMIFEYTCFCAIDPDRRIEYFDLVYKILNDNGLLFGIFIPLDKDTKDGPPFRVSIDA